MIEPCSEKINCDMIFKDRRRLGDLHCGLYFSYEMEIVFDITIDELRKLRLKTK